jgi:V/A-type H+-transporting ATPase subunit C
MPDYDYGNARLHVMRSRLLRPESMDALANAGSLQGLIAALTKTVYQASVEAALTRATGMTCIEEALRDDLIDTVGKLGQFYRGTAAKLVAITIRSYEIQNLKTILRGLAKHAPAGEILAVLLPIGELSLSTMRDLARLNNPREAIDLLASMGLPFAGPLLRVRGEMPGAEAFELELALDQWHFQEAGQTIQSESGSDDVQYLALMLDADLMNLLTVIRFAHDPQQHILLHEQLGVDKLDHLFVGPGRIPTAVLIEAASQDTVAGAAEKLAGTEFSKALSDGVQAYARSNRLSAVERRLRRFRLDWLARQFARDPLGIGVVLGYVALKVNEVCNLRWITHGINLGLRPTTITADLEVIQ